MNAERLHAIAILVRDDLAQTEAPDLLSQLAAALRAAVDEPTDATNQEEMGSLRVRLRDVLVGSRTK